jgi:hypothetical protein
MEHRMKVASALAGPISTIIFFLSFYRYALGQQIDATKFFLAAALSVVMAVGIGLFTSRGK